MKKLFENWRHFKENLNMPPMFSPMTQAEFAEGHSKLGTYRDSQITEDQKAQIRVLVGLFKDLETAEELSPEEEEERKWKTFYPERGDRFTANQVLNSIYTASGESDEFVFPNKSVALDFFNSASVPKEGGKMSDEELALAPTLQQPKPLEPTMRQLDSEPPRRITVREKPLQ